MFKLILIIAMGGMYSDSGVHSSQQEYIFPSKQACEDARNFYRRKDVEKFLNYSAAEDQIVSRKNVKVLAECFPNK